jgi:hypothetical protein
MTTTRTFSAPATRVWAATSPTISRAFESRAIVSKPPKTSPAMLAGPSGRSMGGSCRSIRAISSADQRNAPAVTAKTTPVLVAATSRPPNAGPTNTPTLSIVLAVTFAAVRSSGSSANPGSTAACAGRNAPPATVTTVASV